RLQKSSKRGQTCFAVGPFNSADNFPSHFPWLLSSSIEREKEREREKVKEVCYWKLSKSSYLRVFSYIEKGSGFFNSSYTQIYIFFFCYILRRRLEASVRKTLFIYRLMKICGNLFIHRFALKGV
ncbi:hypothetical protein TorRG33x02_323370, partial [Trema orientale]